MAEIMQDALKVAIGIVGTLIIAAIVFMGIRSGKTVSQNAQGELSYLAESMQDEFTELNGEYKSGAQVINKIKEWDAKNERVSVVVRTRAGGNKTYIYNNSLTTYIGSDLTDAKTKTNNNYINESASFLVTLTFLNGSTETVSGVTFTQR